MKCLQLIVEASNVVVDLETLDLVFASVDHTNRYTTSDLYLYLSDKLHIYVWATKLPY